MLFTRTTQLKVHDRRRIGAIGAAIIEELIQSRPQAVIGLATGSSPLSLYKALALKRLNLSQVRWFALDEYVGLPPDHPQSYSAVIRREVTDPLDVDPNAVFMPDGQAEDLNAAAAAYEMLIHDSGGIDLQILGLGHNGHLAFNEPGSSFDSRTRVEILSESTRQANARFFPALGDVPTHCITQGLATILNAKRLLLIVQGSDKGEILHRALAGPVTRSCPASVLQLHPDVTVLVDEAAAAPLQLGAGVRQ